MVRLYVKWPGQTLYRPVNWREGKQVGNLIYATLFKPEDVPSLEAELRATADHNVGMQWQFRKV